MLNKKLKIKSASWRLSKQAEKIYKCCSGKFNSENDCSCKIRIKYGVVHLIF
jgi:hypothetical protein